MLFSEGKIGSLTVKNRLIMTAMGCGLAGADGIITDDFIQYYENCAKGGVGLIVTEVACVDSVHGQRSAHQIHLSDDNQLPMLRKLTDAVHKYGACIFPQLHHPGVMSSCVVNGNEPLVSPSGIESRFIKEPARALTKEEIHQLVRLFAEGAVRAKKAGFDGVEIHGAHHYLIHQFLSPHFNKRDDEYGGSFENRTRFLKEVVIAVREAVGKDYPISVRVSGDEFYGDEGYHLEEGVAIAKMLDSLGVDLINVSAGGTDNGKSHSIEPSSYKQGWKTYLGESIKKRVSCAVAGTSVYREVSFADKVVSDGRIDFIGMGRPFLADPFWPSKYLAGRQEDIRPCISCLYCIDNVKSEHHVECSVNPLCGNGCSPERKALSKDTKIAVVGAGVCGMEAACVLAERGASVDLFEKNGYLGGQLALAANVPGKTPLHKLFIYYRCRLDKAGVVMKMNTKADEKNLRGYDLIVNASGATPVIPAFLGEIKHPGLLTPVDILSGANVPENKNVVIIGTGMTGLETAEYLIDHDDHITLIEMASEIAPGANRANVYDIVQKLNVADSVIMLNRKLKAITSDSVIIVNTLTNEEFDLPADVVVLSLGVRNSGELERSLKEAGLRYQTLGDAERSGRIYDAIHSAYKFASELEI